MIDLYQKGELEKKVKAELTKPPFFGGKIPAC